MEVPHDGVMEYRMDEARSDNLHRQKMHPSSIVAARYCLWADTNGWSYKPEPEASTYSSRMAIPNGIANRPSRPNASYPNL